MKKYQNLLSGIGALMFVLFLMICFCFLLTGFYTTNVNKNSYTKSESEFICHAIKFKLSQNETVTTVYFPGVLQATTYLVVQIHNVNLKDDFLGRFNGSISNEEIDGAYTVEMFTLNQTPKDYYNRLEFNPVKKTASFKISGYIPELYNVYKMADDPIQPFLHNTNLIICSVLEIVAVIIFVIIFIVYKKQKKCVYK